MPWESIHQSSRDWHVSPNLPDYDQACAQFSWGQAQRQLNGLPDGGGLNMAHEAVVAHHVTGPFALDLHPQDIFWCTADPGWVTGTSYGIIAPLTNGVTSIIDEGDFDAERWCRILEDQRVTVWYTALTAIRTDLRIYGNGEIAA